MATITYNPHMYRSKMLSYIQEERPTTKEEAIKTITPIIANRMKLIYNLSQACNVLVNSVCADLQAHLHTDMVPEKKKHFYKLMDAINEADKEYERFAEKDLTASALASGGYHVADGYRQDANELVRAMMLYIDRAVSPEIYKQIMEFYDSLPEGGIFRKEEMEQFSYIAKYRVK